MEATAAPAITPADSKRIRVIVQSTIDALVAQQEELLSQLGIIINNSPAATSAQAIIDDYSSNDKFRSAAREVLLATGIEVRQQIAAIEVHIQKLRYALKECEYVPPVVDVVGLFVNALGKAWADKVPVDVFIDTFDPKSERTYVEVR